MGNPWETISSNGLWISFVNKSCGWVMMGVIWNKRDAEGATTSSTSSWLDQGLYLIFQLGTHKDYFEVRGPLRWKMPGGNGRYVWVEIRHWNIQWMNILETSTLTLLLDVIGLSKGTPKFQGLSGFIFIFPIRWSFYGSISQSLIFRHIHGFFWGESMETPWEKRWQSHGMSIAMVVWIGMPLALGGAAGMIHGYNYGKNLHKLEYYV